MLDFERKPLRHSATATRQRGHSSCKLSVLAAFCSAGEVAVDYAGPGCYARAQNFAEDLLGAESCCGSHDSRKELSLRT
jgi:hypothetical protein